MFDILQILQDNARKDIEAREDRKVIDLLRTISNVGNLGIGLRDIPNTRWKKFKYHIKNAFGLIK